MYVNHTRRVSLIGDIARDADGDLANWWFYGDDGRWVTRLGYRMERAILPARLRLLVDGETGQAVT